MVVLSNDNMAEICSSLGDFEQCMEGEWLLIAVIIELTFYFLAFTFGHVTLNWIKKEWRKRKKGD
tara:strand:+ start:1784 stop:1978 length:195 start_codon:yes stop_codon:yes gene_type:complete